MISHFSAFLQALQLLPRCAFYLCTLQAHLFTPLSFCLPNGVENLLSIATVRTVFLLILVSFQFVSFKVEIFEDLMALHDLEGQNQHLDRSGEVLVPPLPSSYSSRHRQCIFILLKSDWSKVNMCWKHKMISEIC